jgi:hypothetical protein
MDHLAGRRDIRFGIRAWLPPILNARYNELLRIRGELGKGQLFVDIVTKPPYVILRRKERQATKGSQYLSSRSHRTKDWRIL